MKCPNCGLENPESALRCDCGYNFSNKTVEAVELTKDQIEKKRISILRSKKFAFLKNKFIGSTITLVFGWLCFMQGCAADNSALNPSMQAEERFAARLVGLAGWVMILGATAYRSARRRKLEIISNSIWRIIFELFLMLLIVLAVLVPPLAVPKLQYEHPFTFIFIPAWAFVAYFWAFFRRST